MLEHVYPALGIAPRGVLMLPRVLIDEPLRIWTDSDWAGGVTSRRSCSGGDAQRHGGIICHLSEAQATMVVRIALGSRVESCSKWDVGS